MDEHVLGLTENSTVDRNAKAAKQSSGQVDSVSYDMLKLLKAMNFVILFKTALFAVLFVKGASVSVFLS